MFINTHREKKIGLQVSFVVFVAVCCHLCQSASVQKRTQEAKKDLSDLSDLFDIDVETQPEDGSIKGLRIRRSGGGGGGGDKNVNDEEENIEEPYIDIQKIKDGSITVNGIHLRRSDLSDLADVEFDEEGDDSETASSDRTRRSGGDLISFLGAKLQQKLSLLASSSSGHNAESDLHYGTPVTVSWGYIDF